MSSHTHRSSLREWLHKLHPLRVDLNQSQQVPGLDCLEKLDHLSSRRCARLLRILVVHILSVDELLPHRPVGEKIMFSKVFPEKADVCCETWCAYISLEGLGFGEGEERFASMISLKLLFPMFLASWGGIKKHEWYYYRQEGTYRSSGKSSFVQV